MTKPDVVETREVVFHDRKIAVLKPSVEQSTVLVRLARLKEPEHYSDERKIATINRLPLLVSSLCANEEDWDWVEDGLADGTVQWQEVIDLLADAFKVWDDKPAAADPAASARRSTAKRVRAGAGKVIEGTVK
jgi:hypothetical protein